MEVGLRVVRGPDWQWQDQDGGEGSVGTVVEIGGRANNSSPENTVVVQWDSGMRTNYRCGYQNAYDLRVFDNAPCGVKHPEVSCRGCSRKTIKGFLFKCTKCADVSLCSACYFGDKHEMTHSFYRIDTPASRSVKVPKRANSERRTAKGIFVGANVVRGFDWNWEDQDGGPTKTGKVQEIRSWEQESFRSVACVQWFATRFTNVYRLGHKGKVDLKCITFGEADGGSYYVDHLPVLGMTAEPLTNTGTSRFRIGDSVRVVMQDIEALKRYQADHGGWNARMGECLSKTGRVHRITEKGDIRVQYERYVRWTFNPDVLVRTDDAEKQSSSPTPLASAATDARPDAAATAAAAVVETSEDNASNSPSARLLNEAAQGNVQAVEQLVMRHADSVNRRVAGKTALQVAAHLGRVEVLQLLMRHGAELDLEDDEHDTALHYAAFGNQPLAIELLLERGASPNKQNGEKRCTPLHVAVNKQLVDCVVALLHCDATDVNAQDTYGDTPLHDAINKGVSSAVNDAVAASQAHAIAEALIRHARCDPLVRNKRGFNCVHQGALKGNLAVIQLLAERWPSALDLPKDDGFSSLHIAALNGHLDVVRFLLDSGVAVDACTHKRQTALMLAVAQNYAPIAALLLERGANVNAVDDNGDSCLFMSLLTLLSTNTAPAPASSSTLELDAFTTAHSFLERLLKKTRAEMPPQLVLITFLIQKGANLSIRNQRNETVVDYAERMHAEVTYQHAQFNNATAAPKPPNFARLENALKDLNTIQSALIQLRRKSSLVDLLPPEAFCTLCQEELADVVFVPCRHRLVCIECCRRIKKCMACQSIVEQKLVNNQDISKMTAAQSNAAAAPLVPLPQNRQSMTFVPTYGANVNFASGSSSQTPAAGTNGLNTVGPARKSTALVDPNLTQALQSENCELRRQLQDARHEAEMKLLCPICLDNEKAIAFSCGHTYCSKCAEQLTKTCPTCRKPITKRFNVFI